MGQRAPQRSARVERELSGPARRLKELQEQERSDLTDNEKNVLRQVYRKMTGEKAFQSLGPDWVFRRVQGHDWIDGLVLIHSPPSARHHWQTPITREEACFWKWRGCDTKKKGETHSERRKGDKSSKAKTHRHVSSPSAARHAKSKRVTRKAASEP